MRVANAVDHKVILVGDPSVGKTSIIQQYSMHVFSPNSEPTVGASFISKIVDTGEGVVQMHIWDTAGQERYKSLIPMYVRNAVAAVLVCDPTRPSTFKNLSEWCRTVENIKNIYIVANKCDLDPEIDPARIEEWAQTHGWPFFETSAKDFDSVHKVFQRIAEDIQSQQTEIEEPPVNANSIVVNETAPQNKTGCC